MTADSDLDEPCAALTDEQCARLKELRGKRPHLNPRETSELERLLQAEFEASLAPPIPPLGSAPQNS